MLKIANGTIQVRRYWEVFYDLDVDHTEDYFRRKIDEQMRDAVRAKDKHRLSTIRMMRASIQNREIEKRDKLTEEEIIQTLSSLVKKARESIDQFQKGSVNHLTHDVINPVQEKVYEPNMHMNDVAVEVAKYTSEKEV